METLNRAFTVLMIMALLGVMLATYGCSKTDENGQTVGQKVDRAIDKTNEAASVAGKKMESGADKAGAAMQDAGKKIEEGAGKMADKAGDAVRDAAAKAREGSGKVASVVDDSVITASVKADLLKDANLSAFKVDVSTNKGEVTLKGNVDTTAAKERASRLALGIEGVTKVNNELQVSPKSAAVRDDNPLRTVSDTVGEAVYTSARLLSI